MAGMTSYLLSDGAEEHDGVSPTFLGLPKELRMLIYDILVGNRTYWINFPHDGFSTQNGIIGSLSLLRVNRQVHDEHTREKLRATDRLGCKQVLVLSDFYPIFNQAHVELITDSPTALDRHSIVSRNSATGKEEYREVDVLIWATGML